MVCSSVGILKVCAGVGLGCVIPREHRLGRVLGWGGHWHGGRRGIQGHRCRCRLWKLPERWFEEEEEPWSRCHPIRWRWDEHRWWLRASSWHDTCSRRIGWRWWLDAPIWGVGSGFRWNHLGPWRVRRNCSCWDSSVLPLLSNTLFLCLAFPHFTVTGAVQEEKRWKRGWCYIYVWISKHYKAKGRQVDGWMDGL